MCDLLADDLDTYKEETKVETPFKEETKTEEKSKHPEIKNLFLPPNNLHPLNYVDFIEHNYPYFFTLSSPDAYYHLSSYKSRNNLKFSPLEFSKKEILSQLLFDKIEISSMAVHEDFVFSGDDKGVINMFSCEGEKVIKKFETGQVSNHIVTSIDVSKDGAFLVAGYSNGYIAMWNINESKLITVITDKHSLRIVAIKFISAIRKRYVVISSDQSGQIQKLLIEEKLWRVSIKDDSIYKDNEPTFIIELYKHNADSKITLAALGTVGKIRLYIIDPSISLLCDYVNPDSSIPQKVPDVSFGIGCEPRMNVYGFVNQIINRDDINVMKNEIMLAISWDRIIKLYSLSIEPDGSIEMLNEGKSCGFFVNTYPISRIGFISSSIIYFFDTQKQIKIFNTSLIHYGEYNPNSKKAQEVCTKALIEEGLVVDPKILAEDISFTNAKQFSYRNFIIGTDKSICLLCRGSFHRGKLLSYEECINKVASKNEWMDALCIGLDIYRGILTSFPDIPTKEEERKEKLSPFLEELILDYVTKTIKKESGMSGDLNLRNKTNLEAFNKCMMVAVEFCIGFKAVNFLFTTIQDIFMGYSDDFVRNVEPFIFSDILKNESINDFTITSLIATYACRDTLGILSHIIPHLNFESINNALVKQSCKKYNLFTSMIYLYSNGNDENDFFLPITELYAYFSNEKNYINELAIEDYDSYTEVIKDKGITSMEKMKAFIGHKLLWYIDMCVNGKKLCLNINDRESYDTNTSQYKSLIAMIFVWLLKSKIFKSLIEFDSFSLFFILTKLFSNNKLLDIINHFDFSSLNSQFTQCNELDSKSYNDLMVTLTFIFNLSKGYKSYFIIQDLNLFLIKIATKHGEKVVAKSMLIPAVKKVLSYYENVSTLSEQEVKEDKFKCHGLNTNGNNDYTNLDKVTINVKNYINETSKIILALLSSNYALTPADLSTLLVSCEYTHYTYVKIKLLEMKKDYVECLKVYIKNSQLIGEAKVFEWINEKLRELINLPQKENEPTYIAFKKEIVENTLGLATISIESTMFLFDKWFINDKKTEIISKLAPNPEFQYKYIERVLNDKNSPFNTIDDLFDANLKRNPNAMTNSELKADLSNLLMLHFELLIKLDKKEEIVKNIQKRYIYYPIEQCIKRCIDNHIVDCAIFLYKSTGDYQQAMNLAIKELNQTLDDLYTTNDLSLIEKSKENISQCVDISESSNDQMIDTKQNDNLWFCVLKALYDFLNRITPKGDKDIIGAISALIESFLKKMCLYVKMKEILEFIIINYKESDYKEFKELIIKILQSFGRYTNVLKSAKILLSNALVYGAEHFNKVREEGTMIKLEKCDWCRRKFIKGSNESIIVFQCGHKIHSKCYYKEGEIYKEEPICVICKQNELDKNEEEINSTKRKISLGSKEEYMKQKERREELREKRRRMNLISELDKQFFNKMNEYV